MEIRAGIYDVYETGTVISMRNNPVDFLLEDLLFRFQFIDEPTRDQNKLEAVQIDERKGIQLNFYNFNSSLGTGNREPLPLGWLNNRTLYLNYRIYALQTGHDKLIHFTWYLGEVRHGK